MYIRGLGAFKSVCRCAVYVYKTQIHDSMSRDVVKAVFNHPLSKLHFYVGYIIIIYTNTSTTHSWRDISSRQLLAYAQRRNFLNDANDI